MRALWSFYVILTSADREKAKIAKSQQLAEDCRTNRCRDTRISYPSSSFVHFSQNKKPRQTSKALLYRATYFAPQAQQSIPLQKMPPQRTETPAALQSTLLQKTSSPPIETPQSIPSRSPLQHLFPCSANIPQATPSPSPLRDLTRLLRKIQDKDEITLSIGIFPLLHCQPNGEYRPYAQGFRLGLALYVDVFNLYTLLNERWVSSGAIDGMFAELAVLLLGVQLMSSEKAFIHLCKLKQNGLV